MQKEERPFEASFIEPDKPTALARSKLLGALEICEAGSCFVEKGSIYGTAILMPQLARSMNWHRVLAVEAFKSFILMFASLFLQAST